MELGTELSPESWGEVRRMFAAATEIEPSRRAAWLHEHVDPALVGEVRLLLEADSIQESPLDDPGRFLELTLSDMPSAPDLPRSAGERMGAFEIRSVLGVGQSGVVYRAWQANPPREVALKVIRASVWLPSAPDRFETEVRALARLNHPGIARVYEVGAFVEPGGVRRPYLVAELIEDARPITAFGESLASHERLALVLALCEAVEHAHQRGVLHRDLKPGNVLVGNDGRVRVIDFGIARLQDDGPRSTLPGQLLGTPAYMSPEQAAAGDIDTRTDIYAIGLMLHELSCADANSDLRAVIRKATAEAPNDRYQSVRELGEELRRLQQGLPIEARPPTLIVRAWMFARRRPALFAAFAISLLAVVGTGISMGVSAMKIAAANQDAREAAEFMLDTLLTRLEDRIGTLDDRVRLAEALLKQLDHLATRSVEPSLIRDRARLLGILGDALQTQGRFEESLAVFRRAREDRVKLADSASSGLDDRIARSISIVRVGDLCGALGRTEEQRRCYENARSIDEQLLRGFPAKPVLLSNLGFSFARLSSLATNRGEHDEAIRLAREHVRLAADRRKVEANNPTAALEELDANAFLGNALRVAGRVGEATELAKSRLECAEALRKLDGGSRRTAIRLVSILNATSAELTSDGNAAAASLVGERAVQIAMSMYESDPSDREAALWLIRALSTHASALLQADRPEEAGQASTRADLLLQSLAASPLNQHDPEVQDLTRHVIGCHVNCLRRLNQRTEADACARRWLNVARAEYASAQPKDVARYAALLHDALSLLSAPTDQELEEINALVICLEASTDLELILEVGVQSARAGRIEQAMRAAMVILERAPSEQSLLRNRATTLLKACGGKHDPSP